MLQVNNLSKYYHIEGSDHYILKELNLSVGKGEKVAIIGKSGSGKSTLLSIISGIISPDQGEVIIDGTDCSKLKEGERTKLRSRDIGIIFQDFKLVDHLTGLENVMLPLQINNYSNPTERAMEMLKLVGLESRSSSFPNTLSGGERQRVGIARAMAIDSKVILADEPNANLDIETGRYVMDYLFEVCNKLNKTLLLVTHDRDLARECDITYGLKAGHLEKM